MKDNMYDLINDGDFDVDAYGDIKLNDIENRRMKKNFKKSNDRQKVKYKKVVAGFVTVLAISIAFCGTEAGAKVITTVTKSIESFLNINKNIDDYKTVVNNTVKDNGFTIKINEVILDDNKLIISKNITSEYQLNDGDYCEADEKIYINDKEVKFNSAIGGDDVIDEYTRQFVTEYNLSELENLNLNEDLYVKIVYNNIFLASGDSIQDINGDWEFEVIVNKGTVEKTIESNELIKLDGEFILPNKEKVILEGYKSNDIEQRIYAKKEIPSSGEYNIELKGIDDLGNEVQFYCIEGTDDGYIFKYYNGERNIDENATKLILKPYAVKFDVLMKEDNYNYEEIGEEFVIDLNN